ncbi:MAG: exodeoxyribonuclease VII small subunit [Oscillospiraceae bacterium]|nr:exodeoxyribonuclease VII small subunit [Oscillospiraceae bacterium]
MNTENMSYEQAIERLNRIVTDLEKGNLPLSDSLTLFEEGTALMKRCSELLDQAEQKVVMLKKGADGAPVELPFEEKA